MTPYMRNDDNEITKAETQAKIERLKSTDFKGEPAYVLLIHSDDPYLNKGGIYKTIIEISGAGDVDCAKITISMPSYLVDGDVTFRYKFSDRDPEEPILSLPANVWVPPILFTNYDYKPIPDTGYNSLCNVGEMKCGSQKEPILSFSFQVAKDAPEGSHKIFLNLSYKGLNSNIWYIDKQVIDIHIRHWYEKTHLQYIIVGSLIITAISALIMIYNEYHNHVISLLKDFIVFFYKTL